MAKVGVVLSGCGVFDGSEITEAVAILVALDKRGARVTCLAPGGPQTGVVNHLTKKPDAHPRNIMEESARIARGKVTDLATARAADFDAIVFPGGFGAAKNLSDFASKGAECSVHPEVQRIVREMHAAGKPVGLACIAPVLAAKILGGHAPQLTIGTDKGTADAIRSMGGKHVDTEPTGVCVDERNRLVTTPCYMNDVGPWVVYQGAERMVEEVLRMAGSR